MTAVQVEPELAMLDPSLFHALPLRKVLLNGDLIHTNAVFIVPLQDMIRPPPYGILSSVRFPWGVFQFYICRQENHLSAAEGMWILKTWFGSRIKMTTVSEQLVCFPIGPMRNSEVEVARGSEDGVKLDKLSPPPLLTGNLEPPYPFF